MKHIKKSNQLIFYILKINVLDKDGKMYRLLDIVVKNWQIMHDFCCFYLSWVTFRLLGDL